MPAPTMKDAVQDLRVSLADARDEYDKTVARAKRTQEQQERNARMRYATACRRARAAAMERRAWRVKMRGFSDARLNEIRPQIVYRLSAEHAVYTDPDERVILQQHLDMLDAELTRPGRSRDNG